MQKNAHALLESFQEKEDYHGLTEEQKEALPFVISLFDFPLSRIEAQKDIVTLTWFGPPPVVNVTPQGMLTTDGAETSPDALIALVKGASLLFLFSSSLL